MDVHYLTVNDIRQYAQYLFTEEHSARTIEKYSHDVQTFYRELPDEKTVSKEMVLKWKNDLIQSGYAIATINSMLAAVNGLCRFMGWGECQVKPLKQQRQIFRDESLELTRAEYLSLLVAAKQKNKHRLMLVMETICSTGIRVSELQYITVEAAKCKQAIVNCKNKSRVIILPGKLCQKLLSYCRRERVTGGTIFLSRNGRPLNRSNIWADMKKLCDVAGVSRKKVFPHNLRHLFARMFYNIDKDIVKLADVLGHSSINTTRIYIMESGAEHEKMISRLRLII